jgi:hypothetical protein
MLSARSVNEALKNDCFVLCVVSAIPSASSALQVLWNVYCKYVMMDWTGVSVCLKVSRNLLNGENIQNMR